MNACTLMAECEQARSKVNDYLLEQAANKKPGYKMVNGKRVCNKAVPVYLQAVSNLCNQLLRAGTSIGAKQLLEQRA